MLTVAQRQQHADAAIARAMRTLEAVQADLAATRLEKRATLVKELAKGLREAVVGAVSTAVGELVPMQKASGTPAEPFSPAMLAKVSAMVGFPVDAAMATAALAEGLDETPAGRWFAARGIRLDDLKDPAEALPAELRKALGLDPARAERLAKAATAREERTRAVATSRRNAVERVVRQEAARVEVDARNRGLTEEVEMAKAAGAGAADIFDVARSIQPTHIHPQMRSAGFTDKRDELRRLRTLQIEMGDHTGAEVTRRELAAAEIRATQQAIEPHFWPPASTPETPPAV